MTVASTFQMAPLGYVAEVRPSGVSKTSAEDESDVRLCNYTDIYYNDRITRDLEFMRATASSSEIERLTLREGDVVITKDSETADDIGIPALIAEPIEDLVLGYHNALIRPDRRKLDPRFLFWSLVSRTSASHFEAKARGVTRVGLRVEDIEQLRIPLPPLREQRQLADMLDTETAHIGLLIDKNEAVDELARTRLRALAAEVFCPDPVPMSWKQTRAKWVLREIDERAGARWTELPHLSVSEYSGVIPRRTDNTGQTASEDSSHYKVCRSGDLVLNTLWAFRGGIGVSDRTGLVSPAYAVLRPAGSALPRFLHHLFRSPPIVAEMAARSRGIGGIGVHASRSPHLRVGDLGRIPLAIPDQKTQQRLAIEYDKEIALVDRLSERLRHMNERLRTRRQALVTAAVTGRL